MAVSSRACALRTAQTRHAKGSKWNGAQCVEGTSIPAITRHRTTPVTTSEAEQMDCGLPSNLALYPSFNTICWHCECEMQHTAVRTFEESVSSTGAHVSEKSIILRTRTTDTQTLLTCSPGAGAHRTARTSPLRMLPKTGPGRPLCHSLSWLPATVCFSLLPVNLQ